MSLAGIGSEANKGLEFRAGPVERAVPFSQHIEY